MTDRDLFHGMSHGKQNIAEMREEVHTFHLLDIGNDTIVILSLGTSWQIEGLIMFKNMADLLMACLGV